MWPETDETPPRPADALLPDVLRRGHELRRVRRRRQQAGWIGRAAGVMAIAGLAAAVVHGGPDAAVRTQEPQIAAGPSSTEPGTSTSTGAPTTAGGVLGTIGGRGTTSTVSATSPRTAPLVVLEQRDTRGRYRTAVLTPGATSPLAITAATTERQSPVVSPDGRLIAFQQLVLHPVTNEPRWEVFVVSPDGSELRQVTGGLLEQGPTLLEPPLGPGNRWPSWSPDGTQLAFSCSGPTGLPQICVVRADGTGRHPISLEGQGYYQPSWSPDGRTIAVKREIASGLVDLWLLDPTGKTLPVALPAPAIDARDVTLTWLADNTIVYGHVQETQSVLQALNVVTGTQWTLPISGPARFPVACGSDQVLYLQTSTPVGAPQLRTGPLLVAGVDGSSPTVLLPASPTVEWLPSSCATR